VEKLPWPRTFEAELEPKLTLNLETNELEDLYYDLLEQHLKEGHFTSGSWNVFINAMDNAKTILDDDSSTGVHGHVYFMFMDNNIDWIVILWMINNWFTFQLYNGKCGMFNFFL